MTWRCCPSSESSQRQGTIVHHIQVGYELGCVIMASSKCLLMTLDSTGPKDKSSPMSTMDCEYEQGHIIFNQNHKCKEFWRPTIDEEGESCPDTSPPDKNATCIRASLGEFPSADTHRGHFRAWAPSSSARHRPDLPFLVSNPTYPSNE